MPPKHGKRTLSRARRKVQRAAHERRRPRARTPEKPSISPTPDEVLAVLAKIEEQKKRRKRDEIVNELDVIHARIILALKHYGLPGTLQSTQSELDMVNTSILRCGFNASEQKDKMEQKRQILDLIASFFTDSGQRKAMLQEVLDWLHAGEITELPTDEDVENLKSFLKESSETIKEVFAHTAETTDRIRALGDQLLKEAGYINSDDEDESDGGRRLRAQAPTPIKNIFDESQLVDPDNLHLALDEVKGTLESSIRMVKTNQQKTVFRNAAKQFKFILKALNGRFSASAEKDEIILKHEVEINTLQNAKTRLEEEVAQKEKNINKLDARISANAAKTANLEAQRLAMENEKEALEEEVEALHQRVEKAEAAATRSLPKVSHTTFRSSATLVSVTPRPSGQQVKAKESVMAVTALRAELDEAHKELQTEKAHSEQLQQMLQEEQLKVTELQEQVEIREGLEEEQQIIKAQVKKELKKEEGNGRFQLRSLDNESDTLEQQLERLRAELECKNEMLQQQEKRLQTMKAELLLGHEDADTPGGAAPTTKAKQGEMKRIMVRLRKDHENELVQLRAHIDKEKQRLDATLRRVEQGHKEQLSNVHKQSIHLLRAINRFKGAVAVILERENLQGAANDVRQVPDLPTDDAPSDTRLLLAQMAGNAVELLVTVEFKLSQALMNKRLEVKDKAFAHNFASKDLELQVMTSTRAKQTAETLVDKLKKTKERLKQSEAAIIELRKQQDKRFNDITKRNEKLMDHYKNIQRQMQAMQSHFGHSLKGKEDMLKAAQGQKFQLSKVIDEQNTTIHFLGHHHKQMQADLEKKYRLSVTDQQSNLQQVQKALTDGLITREMHTMTVGVIKQYLTLPRLRLRALAERYLAFRRLQDAKAQLSGAWQGDGLMSARQGELDSYLDKIDEQLASSNAEWTKQHEELDQQRQQLFSQMSDIFSDMVSTSALLKVFSIQKPQGTLPVGEKGTEPSERPSGKGSAGKGSAGKGSAGKGLPGHELTLPPLTPPKMAGTGVPLTGIKEPMWKLPELPVTGGYQRNSTWHVPRLLDMDVNQGMRKAHRVLNPNTKRPSLTMATVEGYDYEECVVRSLEEIVARHDNLPPQRPSTPVGVSSLYINKVCTCGSICANNCGPGDGL